MGRKVNYRLKILEKLSEGPKKFNELRKATGSSEATIFRHLKRLEKEERITYDHSDRTYRIVTAGTNDLAKNMVTDAISKMPVASISTKKFEKIWEKFSRSEGKSLMHETLHSTVAFLTDEEKEGLKKGKFVIPTGDFIPATAFFWLDKKNQHLLQNADQFVPIINDLIAGMRISVATAREGRKPTDEGLASNIKELKWLKASYDFEGVLLVHFDARNRKMLNFLEEQIRRGEERLESHPVH